VTRPTPTQPPPITPGAQRAHWFDRLAHHAASADANQQLLPGPSAQQPDRSPVTVAAAGQSPHNHLSRRSILQKGLLAVGLTLPLRLIKPAQASAASCVGACTAKAVKNYEAAEKLAASFPQSNHPNSTTLEALNGTLIAADIRADADLALASEYQKCSEPNCGKTGATACGPCKAGAPGFHCCLCVPGFDSGSGEPNPILLANSQPCSDYCNLFQPNSIQSDTAC
jgi:hypothetical protein